MRKSLQENKASSYADSEQRTSWLIALKQSWQAALRIDRAQLTAFQAIRASIGFVIPLAFGVATGHVLEGVSMAGGAITVGSVGLTYTYRERTRIMLLDCVGVALSAFVGSVTGSIGWLSVLVAGIWGIGAGLLVAISQPAMVIGLQSAIVLIVLTHFELDPAHAAIQAILMLIGALFQTLLAIVPSPWKSMYAERTALAGVYHKLADYAGNLTDEQSREQVRDALLGAQSTLASGHAQSQQEDNFSALLEEAENIRLNLMLLAKLRQAGKDRETRAGAIAQLDRFMQAIVEELGQIASYLERRRKLLAFHSSPSPKPRQQVKEALGALRRAEGTVQEKGVIRQAVVYGEALRNQLYQAGKLARSRTPAHQRAAAAIRRIPRQAYLQVHDVRAILRANLTLRSTAFRHAMRLGVLLALATALYRLLPLPVERGYWIPLTALLVLRADFSTTFSRGGSRMVGTVLGAVLASLLIPFVARNQEMLVLVDALLAYLALSVLFANYALFSVFITMEVVCLLSFVTPQSPPIAVYRGIDTAIGGGLALLVYVLWPTWERAQVPGKVADRLDALRSYFKAVMKCYVQPDACHDADLHSSRMDLRLARSNAQASMQRALQEPVPHSTTVELARDVLNVVDSIASSVLMLEAYRRGNPAHDAMPALTDFSRRVDESLRMLSTALRDGQSITRQPNLQEALRALRTEKSGQWMWPEGSLDRGFVLAEARQITSSIKVIGQLLSMEDEAVKKQVAHV